MNSIKGVVSLSMIADTGLEENDYSPNGDGTHNYDAEPIILKFSINNAFIKLP